jgi:high-affinity Fe2+/Pb2+ permease
MRIFAGIAIIIAFIGWIIYRLYKKDLKQHNQGVGVFLFFIITWLVIYGVIYS